MSAVEIRGKKCATCGHVGDSKTYDEASFALAETFLPDGTEQEHDDLASAIQERIEEWLTAHGKDG